MSTGALRIGHGYDLHRLEPNGPGEPGRPLVVGGVTLQSPVGPVSHSDGDVLLHAVTDAILGAAGLPDIGQLFPDDDPEQESRQSSAFVVAARERAEAEGWQVMSLDATVVLERPRLSPVKDQIRSRLAELVGTSAVNVKGKSHEGVDAVGEGRAIEAFVVVLLESRPEPAR